MISLSLTGLQCYYYGVGMIIRSTVTNVQTDKQDSSLSHSSYVLLAATVDFKTRKVSLQYLITSSVVPVVRRRQYPLNKKLAVRGFIQLGRQGESYVHVVKLVIFTSISAESITDMLSNTVRQSCPASPLKKHKSSPMLVCR